MIGFPSRIASSEHVSGVGDITEIIQRLAERESNGCDRVFAQTVSRCAVA
jgi:hypothetical protein